MNIFTGVVLVATATALINLPTNGANAQTLPSALQGTPERYISVSLCIQIASSYYHEEQGMEAVKAVGRASYDCRDNIDEYLSTLLETPSISKARRESDMSINEAIDFLKATQIFQMKEEVLQSIITADK